MDRVRLRRHAHHFRAAPRDRAHIGIRAIVLLDHELLGRVDLGDRIGNLEVEDVGGALQPLRVFGTLEDFAAIGAFALEHGARVMQAVGEDMHVGVAPFDELAVVPDDAVDLVVGLRCHDLLLAPLGGGGRALRFRSRHAARFASSAKSGVVFSPFRAIALRDGRCIGTEMSRARSFRESVFWSNNQTEICQYG